MLFTDGTRTIYGVFRGPMRGKSFNLHKADQIGAFEIARDKRPCFEPDYRKMTAQFATPEAPAVFWQA